MATYTVEQGGGGNFTTISAAAGVATFGDTIQVGGGTYNEALHNVIQAGVTVRNKTGFTPILFPTTPGAFGDAIFLPDVPGVSWLGINVNATNCPTNGIRISGSSANGLFQDFEVFGAASDVGNGIFVQDVGCTNNTFRRVKVHDIQGTDNQHQGIYIRTSGCLVEECEFYALPAYAVQCYSNTQSVNGNIIRRNIFRNSTLNRGGVLVGCDAPFAASGNEIYNNIFHHLLRGVELYNVGGINGQPNSGNKVWNNTLYLCSVLGISIEAAQLNAEVRNNIVFQSVGITDSGFGTTANHNFTSDPSFMDQNNNDFRLLAGSPCIDAGIAISAFTTDFTGATRPLGLTWEIGAYEFVPVPPQPPTNLRIVA